MRTIPQSEFPFPDEPFRLVGERLENDDAPDDCSSSGAPLNTEKTTLPLPFGGINVEQFAIHVNTE